MPATAVDVVLCRERETKNKIRFEEVPAEGADEVLGNVYLTKVEDARLGAPERLRVTLEAA